MGQVLSLLVAALATFAAAPAPRPGATVKVLKTGYGRILVDGKGRTLYLFTHDKGSRSRCYDACADAWPPFLTHGEPTGRSGADAQLVGTTRRKGGARQVTYKGRPLYYYVGDRKPGQVLCQAANEFGGYWYVVAPSGAAIT
jgi:predicted lipoprotein with Yx(FWY)xxD motif